MLTSIGLFTIRSKLHKNKTVSRCVILFRKWGLAALAFALCFTLEAIPVFAASTGFFDNIYNTGIYTITILKLFVVLIELIVLGVISWLIVSDLRVIRWFENKKKRR